MQSSCAFLLCSQKSYSQDSVEVFYSIASLSFIVKKTSLCMFLIFYPQLLSALGISAARKVISPGMSLAERTRTMQITFPSLSLIISKSFARSLLA